MTDEDKLLRHYGEIMPMWAYRAYCCNPLIHQVTKECAQRNVKPEDLPWELLAAVLAQSIGMEELLRRQAFCFGKLAIPYGKPDNERATD